MSPATMVRCVLTDMFCGDPMVPHQCLMRSCHVTETRISHDCGLCDQCDTDHGPRGSVGVTPGQVAALECAEVRGDLVTRGVVGGG